jgi:hypothetical protein
MCFFFNTLRVEIRLCVCKSHSMCRNHARACRIHPHAFGNQTRANRNLILRVKIKLVRVKITLCYTLLVETILGRVFWKISMSWKKNLFKNLHACGWISLANVSFSHVCVSSFFDTRVHTYHCWCTYTNIYISKALIILQTSSRYLSVI